MIIYMFFANWRELPVRAFRKGPPYFIKVSVDAVWGEWGAKGLRKMFIALSLFINDGPSLMASHNLFIFLQKNVNMSDT